MNHIEFFGLIVLVLLLLALVPGYLSLMGHNAPQLITPPPSNNTIVTPPPPVYTPPPPPSLKLNSTIYANVTTGTMLGIPADVNTKNWTVEINGNSDLLHALLYALSQNASVISPKDYQRFLQIASVLYAKPENYTPYVLVETNVSNTTFRTLVLTPKNALFLDQFLPGWTYPPSDNITIEKPTLYIINQSIGYALVNCTYTYTEPIVVDSEFYQVWAADLNGVAYFYAGVLGGKPQVVESEPFHIYYVPSGPGTYRVTIPFSTTITVPPGVEKPVNATLNITIQSTELVIPIPGPNGTILGYDTMIFPSAVLVIPNNDELVYHEYNVTLPLTIRVYNGTDPTTTIYGTHIGWQDSMYVLLNTTSRYINFTYWYIYWDSIPPKEVPPLIIKTHDHIEVQNYTVNRWWNVSIIVTPVPYTNISIHNPIVNNINRYVMFSYLYSLFNSIVKDIKLFQYIFNESSKYGYYVLNIPFSVGNKTYTLSFDFITRCLYCSNTTDKSKDYTTYYYFYVYEYGINFAIENGNISGLTEYFPNGSIYSGFMPLNISASYWVYEIPSSPLYGPYYYGGEFWNLALPANSTFLYGIWPGISDTLYKQIWYPSRSFVNGFPMWYLEYGFMVNDSATGALISTVNSSVLPTLGKIATEYYTFGNDISGLMWDLYQFYSIKTPWNETKEWHYDFSLVVSCLYNLYSYFNITPLSYDQWYINIGQYEGYGYSSYTSHSLYIGYLINGLFSINNAVLRQLLEMAGLENFWYDSIIDNYDLLSGWSSLFWSYYISIYYDYYNIIDYSYNQQYTGQGQSNMPITFGFNTTNTTEMVNATAPNITYLGITKYVWKIPQTFPVIPFARIYYGFMVFFYTPNVTEPPTWIRESMSQNVTVEVDWWKFLREIAIGQALFSAVRGNLTAYDYYVSLAEYYNGTKLSGYYKMMNDSLTLFSIYSPWNVTWGGVNMTKVYTGPGQWIYVESGDLEDTIFYGLVDTDGNWWMIYSPLIARATYTASVVDIGFMFTPNPYYNATPVASMLSPFPQNITAAKGIYYGYPLPYSYFVYFYYPVTFEYYYNAELGSVYQF